MAQIAADMAGSADKAGNPGNGIFVNVRFAQAGIPDISGYHVTSKETVRDFKNRLVATRPPLQDRNLRLIYLGRILTDGVFLAPFLSSLLQRQAKQKEEVSSTVANSILTSVTDSLASSSKDVKGKGKARQSVETVFEEPGRTPANAVWLNCSVGEVQSAPAAQAETAFPEISNDEQPSTNVPLTGFDRLREAGFTAEDIAAMRSQFRNRLDAANMEHGPVADDEDEHARALENAWMEGLGNQELASSDPFSAGEYTTIFKGICIGFFFPLIPFFWFRTALFNKRMQMGIMAGTVVNLLFGALRLIA